MDRIDGIQARCDVGRTMRITDVKYLLAEIKRLRERAEKAEAYVEMFLDEEKSVMLPDPFRKEAENE